MIEEGHPEYSCEPCVKDALAERDRRIEELEGALADEESLPHAEHHQSLRDRLEQAGIAYDALWNEDKLHTEERDAALRLVEQYRLAYTNTGQEVPEKGAKGQTGEPKVPASTEQLRAVTDPNFRGYEALHRLRHLLGDTEAHELLDIYINAVSEILGTAIAALALPTTEGETG